MTRDPLKSSGDFPIATKRLEIATWLESHAEAFLKLSQDDGFNAYPITIYRQPHLKGARRWISDAMKQFQSNRLGKWGIWEAASGELIGMTGLTPWMLEGEALVDLTYRLRESAWGQGYGPETTRAVQPIYFGCKRLEWRSNPGQIFPQHLSIFSLAFPHSNGAKAIAP